MATEMGVQAIILPRLLERAPDVVLARFAEMMEFKLAQAGCDLATLERDMEYVAEDEPFYPEHFEINCMGWKE